MLFELILCPRSIANQGPPTWSPSEETDAHTNSVDDDKDILVMKMLTAMLVVLRKTLEVMKRLTAMLVVLMRS